MKFAQLLIMILAFLMIKPTKAGLLLEPVAGYNAANFKIDKEIYGKEKAPGPSFGGRVGYQNLGFQIGVDYLNSSLNVDDDNYKSNLKTNEFAGFVGFEFPVFVRVYAGYIFAMNGETQADYQAGLGKETVEFTSGSGAKAGIGFTGLPLIDINVEYRRGTFTELKIGSIEEDVDTTFNSVMVGVSLPLVL